MTGHMRGDARKALEEQATAAAHDHTGPDWRCEACKPLADVLRARMRWASVHWGTLHDDAYPSLARAIHEAGYTRGASPADVVEGGADPAVALWQEGWEHHRQHPRPIDPEFGINPYRSKP